MSTTVLDSFWFSCWNNFNIFAADNEFQVTSNTTDNKIKLKFKRVKKEQVKDSDAPPSLPKSTSTSEKRKRTAEKSDGSRRGRRKIQKTVDTKPKQEEQEDCIDVETISDKVTGSLHQSAQRYKYKWGRSFCT